MPSKIAVIDIGSNSCRMVIYEKQGAAFLPYFNEKTMAGLGRDLPTTGNLSTAGKVKALETFHRFSAILMTLDITEVYPVATSAVREARDGPSFVYQIERILGAPVRVLTGAQEGCISALGVLAGFARPRGLVADLGGSSLELQGIDETGIKGEGETFLLGPLARSADTDLSLSKRRKTIKGILSESTLLPVEGKKLYAVGGAWRNVAAVHMELTGYPLRVIHGFKMDRKAISNVLNVSLGIGSSKYRRSDIKHIAKRRFDTLPHAALVLDCLLEMSGKSDVRISAYGLREGVLADSENIVSGSPMLDTAKLYLKLSDDSAAFGQQLNTFLQPLFGLTRMVPRVISLACLMADAGSRLHPDHRSTLVFENILRAPIPALNHEERLFVAVAAASRYTFKFNLQTRYQALADDELFDDARMIGTAMRLGGVFSGRSAKILETATLKLDDKALTMDVLSRNADMISGTVKRRLKQLASLLEREAVVNLV